MKGDASWSYLSEDNNMRLRCVVGETEDYFDGAYSYRVLSRHFAASYWPTRRWGSRAFGRCGRKWKPIPRIPVRISLSAALLNTASPSRCSAITLIIAGRTIRRTRISVSFANVKTQHVRLARASIYELRCDSMFYFASTTNLYYLSLSSSLYT